MPRLILDVMGGDHAPYAILDGVVRALPELKGELVLIGDESIFKRFLEKRRFKALKNFIEKPTSRVHVRFVHAPEQIEMSDSIREVRTKKNSPITLGLSLLKEDIHQSGFISAGHSGAVMAAALLGLGRLKGIERPGIAATMPTLDSKGCVVLDVGANIDCKPEHLRDFALMGAAYASVGANPEIKVGILSNGEERSKGNEITRATWDLLEKHPAFICDTYQTEQNATPPRQASAHTLGKFIGYVEGKEIFKGTASVVVTDGFAGNVMLKSAEGVGSAVVSILKSEARRNPLTALGFFLAAPSFKRLKRKLDYAEYGAAPLLGVSGYVFICHGSSDGKAIKNALLRAQSAIESQYLKKIQDTLNTGDSR